MNREEKSLYKLKMGIRGHEKQLWTRRSSVVELLLNKCKALDSTLAKPDNNNEHQGYSPI